MQIKAKLVAATNLIRIVVDEAIKEQLVVLRCQSGQRYQVAAKYNKV